MVFVFFGLVAVIGTTYVQTETWEWAALYAGVGIGALACAILVANNLRDIPTDTVAGKRTLAVRLGEPRTRAALRACSCWPRRPPWSRSRSPPRGACWSGWASCCSPLPRLRTVLGGARGPALVPVLQQTGLAELAWAVLVAARAVRLRLTAWAVT